MFIGYDTIVEMKKKTFASIMLFIATLIWGLSYSIQTISADHLGTYAIVFFKGLGGIFLLPFLILQKKRIDKESLKGGILIGIFALSGCVMQQIGITSSTVSKSSFITALYIIIVPAIGFLLGNKTSKRILVSIVLACVGLYFLCFSASVKLQVGDLYLFLGSICFALQIIYIDKYSQSCDPIVLTFVQQVLISICAGIVMLVWEKPLLDDFRLSLFPILYLVFASGMIAQSLQIIYQKDTGPVLGSLIMSFESVFGALGGWILLSQTLSLREIFGCFLLLAGILLAE